jgi:DNA-3-methyladenine glycosylase I
MNPPQPPSPVRCSWATTELGILYHDTEWGVPLHDEHRLFEFIILEGAQAGLSWETILKKRNAYRQAYKNFDPAIVAKFNARKIESLMADPGIVRNRLKIESSVRSAKSFVQIQKEFGSFDAYVWKFVDGKPIVNAPKTMRNIHARSEISDALSKNLKTRGFNFVGSTICYAFMQAVGMVNDHVAGCFRQSVK